MNIDGFDKGVCHDQVSDFFGVHVYIPKEILHKETK